MGTSPHGGVILPPDAVILESMGVALMAVDERCRITRFNAPAERLTGFSSQDVVGQRCSEVLKASHCTSGCPVQEAMRTKTICRYGTVVLQTRELKPCTVEVTASALVDGRGRVIGAVGLFRDVSEDPGQVRFYGSRVFVSQTASMRRIFDALPKLAASPAPLLIVGGRGSGRSALAETIHHLASPGTPRPLVTVRCTSSQAKEKLSEVLRQEGGLASGTLLLEDICAAPIQVQRQLLAWLEEGTGGLGFRVISTATERLETCLRRGAFRQDLFYRLNVLHVELPDLKERVEDIPLLAEQFIEELNAKRSQNVAGITAPAMAHLLEADFPGNVRQLRMVIDRAHRQCEGALIDVQHLPEMARPWPERKLRLEREAIELALAQTGGNISRAAEVLQMHRTTLWRKLKRYGIKH